MAPAADAAEDGLIWPQWEESPLALWRLKAPAQGDTRAVRWKWVCGWVNSAIEAGGTGDGIGSPARVYSNSGSLLLSLLKLARGFSFMSGVGWGGVGVSHACDPSTWEGG